MAYLKKKNPEKEKPRKRKTERKPSIPSPSFPHRSATERGRSWPRAEPVDRQASTTNLESTAIATFDSRDSLPNNLGAGLQRGTIASFYCLSYCLSALRFPYGFSRGCDINSPTVWGPRGSGCLASRRFQNEGFCSPATFRPVDEVD